MSEAIAEMVLPGTYIEVRAEGLIGIGGISTGNIGIVGTAARGPIGAVQEIGSFSEATELFGAADPFRSPIAANNPLSLVRTLRQLFLAGGRNVFAVRVANLADPDDARATRTLKGPGDADALTLTAREVGSFGNSIAVTVTKPADLELTLEAGQTKETFTGADVAALVTALGNSKLVSAAAVAGGPGTLVEVAALSLQGGLDGADVNATSVEAGLALLEDRPVNIVLVAGLGADVAGAPLAAHVERTENEGRERIAVLGARSTTRGDVESDIANFNSGRIVLVAPGIRVTEPGGNEAIDLPPSYLAALVAGTLSTLAPHVSLTNKALPVADLAGAYNTTTYQSLLQKRVLLVRKKQGFQIVQGISSDPGPFRQISVRRIVDYAKAGVRKGGDPYIGKLNNARVRGALKATLDGFLSQMVLDEMLVAYQLEVTATRSQEINGICSVVMTLQPTFSIDFIRVTMNLQ